MVEQNWYAVLGITSSATESEIKRAFRKLAHIYHPDKNNNPIYFEQFKQIKKAYEILGNIESKKLYDKSIQLEGKSLNTQPSIQHIQDLIRYFHFVEREMKQTDFRFINYDRLIWLLNQGIRLPQFNKLLYEASYVNKQKVLHQLLDCLQFLPFKLAIPYIIILQSSFAETHLMNKIQEFRKNKKWEALWNDFQLLIVALISLLICYGIFYLQSFK